MSHRNQLMPTLLLQGLDRRHMLPHRARVGREDVLVAGVNLREPGTNSIEMFLD